jgi:hypothetical protein
VTSAPVSTRRVCGCAVMTGRLRRSSGTIGIVTFTVSPPATTTVVVPQA